MSDIRVGTQPTTGQGERDAFHVPAIIAIAMTPLRPGQSVRFTDDTFGSVVSGGNGPSHGIVDPWLSSEVKPGELAYVLLQPGTVQKLTHHFDVSIEDVPHVEIEKEDEEDDYDDGCRGCY